MDKEIKRIVLTGGPCGGKTTAIEKIADRVAELGYHVLTVPEAATLLLKGGAKQALEEGLLENLDFQDALLTAQLGNEAAYSKLAQSIDAEKILIILDRGTMDAKAYIDEEGWQNLLKRHAVEEVDLRNGRYDAVVHMVTAANGAEHAYNFETNDQRSEPPELARERDDRMLDGRNGVEKHTTIDNSRNFEKKVKLTVDSVLSILGYPVPLEIEDKYHVDTVDTQRLDDHAVPSEIQQFYIYSADPGVSVRARKRTRDGISKYSMTKKTRLPNGETVETEEPIEEEQYEILFHALLPETEIVRKTRYNFMRQNQYFELDYFHTGQKAGEWLLEIEKTAREVPVQIPEHLLNVLEDVTDDPDWKNENLAKLAA